MISMKIVEYYYHILKDTYITYEILIQVHLNMKDM